MLICLCNHLSDAMVRDAVARGARTPDDVFRRFKKHRGCSACSVKLAQAIERARADLQRESGNQHHFEAAGMPVLQGA